MVIGTFLSALVMFVSAKMVTLTDVLPKDYIAELNTFLFNIAIFGVVACVIVIVIFCLARKWRKMPHFMTLCLGISQVMILKVETKQITTFYLSRLLSTL
jgi:hypothetical protein